MERGRHLAELIDSCPSLSETCTVASTSTRGQCGHLAPCETELLRLMAISQVLEVDFLFFGWRETVLERDGSGATSMIRPRPHTAETGFAFKTFKKATHPDKQSEIYRALTSELYILQHPQIRDHTNFVRLYGVSFDVATNYEGQELPLVWPVLVLERSRNGDLGRFIHEVELTFEQAISICIQIGTAVEIMHQCNIVHGDLKPENVLISCDSSHSPMVEAKIIGFGFSSCGCSDEDFVWVPKTKDWAAPEWHSRAFTIERAKKMDIHTYAKLCAWTLLRGRVGPQHIGGLDPGELTRLILDEHRDELNASPDCGGIRESISSFFQSGLETNPDKRYRNLGPALNLLACLGKHGALMLQNNRVTEFTLYRNLTQLPEIPVVCHDFETLQTVHFLVRTQMFRELKHRAGNKDLRSKQAAFELGMCYALAIGTPLNEALAIEWLKKSGATPELVERNLKRAANRGGFFGPLKNGDLSEYLVYNPAREYMATNLAGEAIKVLRFEIEGKTDESLVHSRLALQLVLANMLGYRGLNIDFDEIGILRRSIATATEKALGPEHTETLRAQSFLGVTLQHEGKYSESEDILRHVLKMRQNILKPSHPDIFWTMRDLGYTLSFKGLDDLPESVELLRRAHSATEEAFGHAHYSYVETARHLAVALEKAGDLGQAQIFYEEALRASKTVYPPTDSIPIRIQRNLRRVLVKREKKDYAAESESAGPSGDT